MVWPTHPVSEGEIRGKASNLVTLFCVSNTPIERELIMGQDDENRVHLAGAGDGKSRKY